MIPSLLLYTNLLIKLSRQVSSATDDNLMQAMRLFIISRYMFVILQTGAMFDLSSPVEWLTSDLGVI